MYEIMQIVSPYGKEDNVLKIHNNSTENIAWTFGDILEIDNEYTFSCWMKCENTTTTEVYISENNRQFDLTNEWQKVVFTSTSNIELSKEVYFTIPIGAIVYAYEGQLEIGNKDTDFSTNPQDTMDSIKSVDDKVITLQTDFKIEQGRIEALIKATTIDGKSLKDKFTEVEATVDGIKTNIGESTFVDGESLNSKLTSINVDVNGIRSEVSEANSNAESAKTIAEQASNKFSWLVKSGTNESNFELTDRTAKLVADDINLYGRVNFSGLNKDVQDKINEGGDFEIGGRNLARKGCFSPYNTNGDTTVTDDDFIKDGSVTITRTAVLNEGAIMDRYVAWESGKDYVISFKLKRVTTNVTSIHIYNGCKHINGSVYIDGVHRGTFGQDLPFPNDENYHSIKITFKAGTADNGDGSSTSTLHTILQPMKTTEAAYTVEVLNYKIEKGTKASDWTPAPEDNPVWTWIQDAVVDGYTTINGGYIKSHTIDIDHLIVENIFADGTAVMNIINAQEINAERITSGKILANYLSLYGMTVYDKTTNKETFSITENGQITLRGDIESYDFVDGVSGWSASASGDFRVNNLNARGNINNADGGLSAETGTGKRVRFWAGSSYEERENAPWIVYNDGSMKATIGEFGGVFTGDIKIGNISIIDPTSDSGGDAIVTIQNGQNGIKVIQLRDDGSSNFAQDINITDNQYNKTIALNQDGSGVFSSGIYVGSETSLIDNSLTLNGQRLINNDSGFIFLSPRVNIGAVSESSFLKVYGHAEIEQELKLMSTLAFGSVVKCEQTSQGLDFNFVNVS